MHTVMTPFGPSLPAAGWVPAPRYALRRACILEAMAALPPGRVLEIGCGAGALLAEFADRGFDVTGVEMSAEGRRRAEMFASDARNMRVIEAPSPAWSAEFDYLFSFEVLEHIEDDRSALRQWTRWLKPGGHVLISVPAHRRLWGASDRFAGHFRRYSKDEVRDLLAASGLTDVSVGIYGFPISNMIEPVRNAYHGRLLKRGASDRDMKAATENSGVDRDLESRLFPLMARFPGRQLFDLGIAIQRALRHSSLGTGWIATGRRPRD